MLCIKDLLKRVLAHSSMLSIRDVLYVSSHMFSIQHGTGTCFQLSRIELQLKHVLCSNCSIYCKYTARRSHSRRRNVSKHGSVQYLTSTPKDPASYTCPLRTRSWRSTPYSAARPCAPRTCCPGSCYTRRTRSTSYDSGYSSGPPASRQSTPSCRTARKCHRLQSAEPSTSRKLLPLHHYLPVPDHFPPPGSPHLRKSQRQTVM
jgi:hypothetical protein